MSARDIVWKGVTSVSMIQTIEVPIKGMDCNECVQHVKRAIADVPGVAVVDVYLAAERAKIQLDSSRTPMSMIHKAVAEAGYLIPEETALDPSYTPASGNSPIKDSLAVTDFSRQAVTLLGLVFGAVLFVVIIGEWLGLFETVTTLVPLPIGALFVLATGYPIFRNVVRATLKRQIISHTLMSIGAIAALLTGQWATAAVVVFFMRIGNYAESFTTERARRAVKDLTAMTPRVARVEQNGVETEVSIHEVQIDDLIVVRPGEQIPVDGIVISGQATINQATITGESMPVEAQAGSPVFAATTAQLGHLKIQTTRIGTDTTFGRVIRMVEEAEAHRADVQNIADKFSAYYLPVVAVIALLVFVISRNPLSTTAVLVVACSCSFALATPIAMLASIGAGAKRGVLIKGGKYIEQLARADVLLIDKTGTVTSGKIQITDVVALNGATQDELLTWTASVERYSEHPLANAVRFAAQKYNTVIVEVENFAATPGIGVHAVIDGHRVTVGSRRVLTTQLESDYALSIALSLEEQGKTLLFVIRDEQLVGILAASDSLRLEIPAALKAVKALGIRQIELLTGDNERSTATLAAQIGINYRANLLPEDKIRIVREYQARGHQVVMIGDGVNDAPALAQAEVGIAMGAVGTHIAIEAAHIVLMQDNWMLVPQVFSIARRTMRIVKMNLVLTVIYNTFGLLLAAFGILPPIFAAAAQSIPDLGILANSARLLRQK